MATSFGLSHFLSLFWSGYDSALQVSNKLQDLYFNGKFDKCILVFNKFVSAISQDVTQQQLIPLDVSESSKEVKEDNNDAKAIYDYEPDEETILKDLLPKNVSIQIFKVLLESDAGEHGARMAAMALLPYTMKSCRDERVHNPTPSIFRLPRA